MASRTILPTDMGISIEDRLLCVTAVCVVSMIHGGLDDGEIRRRVLEIAREVIRALAEDVYQFETHTAIVQRAIDEVLSQAPRAGIRRRFRSRIPGSRVRHRWVRPGEGPWEDSREPARYGFSKWSRAGPGTISA